MHVCACVHVNTILLVCVCVCACVRVCVCMITFGVLNHDHSSVVLQRILFRRIRVLASDRNREFECLGGLDWDLDREGEGERGREKARVWSKQNVWVCCLKNRLFVLLYYCRYMTFVGEEWVYFHGVVGVSLFPWSSRSEFILLMGKASMTASSWPIATESALSAWMRARERARTNESESASAHGWEQERDSAWMRARERKPMNESKREKAISRNINTTKRKPKIHNVHTGLQIRRHLHWKKKKCI